MMTILRVELLSDNLDSTAEFYTNILGIEVSEKTEDSVSFNIGQSVLSFKRSINQQPVYHFAFNIPNNTLDEALFWVSSKTQVIPIKENENIADFTAWNAKAIYFYDNNGNVLEFIARFDLSNETSEPFTASVITGISEIAVVTEDVPKYTERLSKLTGVQPYDKQPLHDNFAALGDANGLFIISQEGRNWFPTDKPCKKFYSKIKIGSGETIREISLNSEAGVDLA
jgi:catechol 2,3-dioxygenase-like lactoylglutathione lyase family enzyme